MAHLGVLHALEQAGLSFDVMSGTSAGAMAGILYAAGMSPEKAIQNFRHDLTPSRMFRYLPKWPNWYLVSQYRRRAWDGMLRKYLHDWRLEQLPIPFHAVTVDLVQVRTVVRRQGDAVHAILESINLPIVSKPILRDGMALVDGGCSTIFRPTCSPKAASTSSWAWMSPAVSARILPVIVPTCRRQK